MKNLLNRSLFDTEQPRPVIKREKKGKFKIVRKYARGAERTELDGLTFQQAQNICRAVHR